jgi:predicted ribosomally synthesized peptide with nif11-like leader
MSEEQLKAFLEAVKADAGLQEKLKAAKDADAVVEIAKEAGFAISAEELKKSQAEMTEISDDELEGVAAGGFFEFMSLSTCRVPYCGYEGVG